ncbi:hypothetical protein GQR58_022188 [Nymphon striatum]|nr:hypothetical protein GQR58_022188 [Nymphon striatum]
MSDQQSSALMDFCRSFLPIFSLLPCTGIFVFLFFFLQEFIRNSVKVNAITYTATVFIYTQPIRKEKANSYIERKKENIRENTFNIDLQLQTQGSFSSLKLAYHEFISPLYLCYKYFLTNSIPSIPTSFCANDLMLGFLICWYSRGPLNEDSSIFTLYGERLRYNIRIHKDSHTFCTLKNTLQYSKKSRVERPGEVQHMHNPFNQGASPVSFTLLGTKGLMASYYERYFGNEKNAFLKFCIPGLKEVQGPNPPKNGTLIYTFKNDTEIYVDYSPHITCSELAT